jgi:hypothetical protein
MSRNVCESYGGNLSCFKVSSPTTFTYLMFQRTYSLPLNKLENVAKHISGMVNLLHACQNWYIDRHHIQNYKRNM